MMRNEPFRFLITRYKLDREAMKTIRAGTSGGTVSENLPRDGDPHRTNGRSTENELLSLPVAYRMLSRRECEVLEKMIEGRTNREIADELFITKSTVEDHIYSIGMTLGLSGRGRVREWVARQKKPR